MLVVIKNIKNKIYTISTAIFIQYKKSNGLSNFLKKGFRYLQENGFHFQQLLSRASFSEKAISENIFFKKFISDLPVIDLSMR